MYKRINVKKQNTSIKVIKTICCLVFFGSIANGNEMPSGPKIKSGNVVINGEGTSHLKINQMTDKSICVMPPKKVKLPKNIIGVCSDYIGHYK